jgi:MFS family permease
MGNRVAMLDPNTTVLLNQLGFDAGLVETMLSSAILLTVLALVTAIPTGIIAKQKGRSRMLWLLFALSVPAVPLLLIWLLPAVPGEDSKQGSHE